MFMLLVGDSAMAQPRDGHFLAVSAGYGLSTPYSPSHEDGAGGYALGEYVLAPSSWIGLRPYAGLILTWPKDRDQECMEQDIECEVTSKAALLGTKGRVTVPIPYVAPYFELGLGLSLGVLRTHTAGRSPTIEGAALHIPVSLGVAIGPNHEVELGFVFYFHPAAKQSNGAIAAGLSIVLQDGWRPKRQRRA